MKYLLLTPFIFVAMWNLFDWLLELRLLQEPVFRGFASAILAMIIGACVWFTGVVKIERGDK